MRFEAVGATEAIPSVCFFALLAFGRALQQVPRFTPFVTITERGLTRPASAG
jgi:hypothetical protein